MNPRPTIASYTKCEQLVGLRPNIAQTRATYLDPIAQGKVTNLLFVNGSVDPWSSLSFATPGTTPAGVTAHVVALGPHCSDLQNLTPYSLVGDFEAHVKFHDLAVSWLEQ